jgi:hypothetical protein
MRTVTLDARALVTRFESSRQIFTIINLSM